MLKDTLDPRRVPYAIERSTYFFQRAHAKRRDLTIAPYYYRDCFIGLVAADQHRDSAVTPELRVAERTGLNLVSRHACIDQRITNVIDKYVEYPAGSVRQRS